MYVPQSRLQSNVAKAKTAKQDVMRSRNPTEEAASETLRAETSDRVLVSLLNRLKATVDPIEIRELSDQIERAVFHQRFTNA